MKELTIAQINKAIKRIRNRQLVNLYVRIENELNKRDAIK
jgi:hypothetical protein